MQRALFALISICFFARTALPQKATALDSVFLSVPKSQANDTARIRQLVKAIFPFYVTEPKNCYEKARQVLAMAKKAHYIKGQAGAYMTMATASQFLGNTRQASRYYMYALRLYEKLNDRVAVGRTYNNLGALYQDQRNYRQAVECYLQSLKIREEIYDTAGVAATYNNIGCVYAEMEQLPEAEEFLFKSLELEKQLTNYGGMAKSYICIGQLMGIRQDWKNAEEMFMKAIPILDSLHDNLSKGVCYSGLASSCVYMRHYKEGIPFALKAISILEPLEAKPQLEIVYTNLCELYAKTGQYEYAIAYFKLLADIREEIYDANIASQSEELLVKYEDEKKRKRIAILEKEKITDKLTQARQNMFVVITSGVAVLLGLTIVFISVFQQQRKKNLNAQLQKTKIELEYITLRSQMNPHFVFNSLNSIQRLYVEGKAELANESMADFSSLMRKVLDNSTRSHISLKEEIDTLKLYLDVEKLRCDGLVNYSIAVDEAVDVHNILVPPLVIQPFAENAIWHGILPKKEIGHITIAIYKNHNDRLECTVSDNGIGYKENNGEANKNHNSKGIHITEKRLGNKIKIENLALGGTRVTLILPEHT
ncbi:MAG TPA: tetratricopeptide repeat protein [Flavobacteriales bacterium]|nr:tetratricopeptide repeat protein [Flavobacteriales bacterium]